MLQPGCTNGIVFEPKSGRIAGVIECCSAWVAPARADTSRVLQVRMHAMLVVVMLLVIDLGMWCAVLLFCLWNGAMHVLLQVQPHT
jgi:hypothetical protein